MSELTIRPTILTSFPPLGQECKIGITVEKQIIMLSMLHSLREEECLKDLLTRSDLKKMGLVSEKSWLVL